MATIKAYSDLQQSRKLAEILPLESADMYYPWDVDSKSFLNIPIVKDDSYYVQGSIPCWSLAALLDYLSANFYTDIRYFDNYWELDCRVQFAYGKELVDACYEMIIKLSELNML